MWPNSKDTPLHSLEAQQLSVLLDPTGLPPETAKLLGVKLE
jgi:hypothetical protein